MSEKIRRWAAAHPNWTLALITFAALAPFLAKPFNIDDPLFIWVARHIQSHPWNPYGFDVNWGWTEFPMWKVTENPPLSCYYMALMAGIVGWSEIGLHTAYLLPAVAAVLGTYRLAKRFCGQPMLAALVALFTPVFLISANTVMCDVGMLAFWVWAVVLWMEGLEEGSFWKLAVAGGLIGLAEMTKYYGACLIPLLAAYAVARRQPVKNWAQFLLIPLAVLWFYQYVTTAAHGTSLLYYAMDYATFSKGFFGVSKIQGGMCGLAFTGGCLAPVVFFAPHLLKKRGWLALLGMATATGVVVFFDGALWKNYVSYQGGLLIWIKIQMVFWVTAGWIVLALALANVWRHRDAGSLLLALWVMGTYVFAAFCNWTVNARSILPMTPALAILIVQWLEKEKGAATNGVRISFVLSALFALVAVCADFSGAVAVRESVDEVLEKYARAPGTLWFQGHWGFQFYMSEAGALAMDFRHPGVKTGDIVAQPVNNTNVLPLNPQYTELVDGFSVPVPGWLTIWNSAQGAGFYASARGPLPFAFGRPAPEIVKVVYFKLLPGEPVPASR